MGYRSDVRLVTSKKGYETLEASVKKFLGKDNSDYNLLDNPDVLIKGKNGVLVGWNSIKWYEDSDYKAIDAIEAGMNHLADKELGYRFARIGESYDDYEEKSEDSKEDDYLPYPSMIREFDDASVEEDLNYDARKGSEKGVEI